MFLIYFFVKSLIFNIDAFSVFKFEHHPSKMQQSQEVHREQAGNRDEFSVSQMNKLPESQQNEDERKSTADAKKAESTDDAKKTNSQEESKLRRNSRKKRNSRSAAVARSHLRSMSVLIT